VYPFHHIALEMEHEKDITPNKQANCKTLNGNELDCASWKYQGCEAETIYKRYILAVDEPQLAIAPSIH